MARIFFITLGLLFASIKSFSNTIFVSDRYQFHDSESLSAIQVKRNGLLKAPFKLDVLSQERWTDMVRDRKVVLMIHGYNNEYDESVEFFSNIVERMKGSYDTFVCYFWPGYDDFWEYLKARSTVTGTELPMRLLGLMEDLSLKAQQVDIISFSMGCRLVLEALNRTSKTLITNLFLLAPAIDNESIEKGERYSPGINNVQKAFIFYSENDQTLNLAYRFIEWDLALGSRGLENSHLARSHVHTVNSSSHINNHHDYSKSKFIFTIISNVLRQDGSKVQSNAKIP